jgi:hypothetical protein
MPNLRVLDFQKVKFKERQMAKSLFDSEKGKQILDDMVNKRYKEEDEYNKAIEDVLKDEENKKKIYVYVYDS